jgi:CHAT domain-containing protein/predicted negative regulator of RcsB-dependent stress response
MRSLVVGLLCVFSACARRSTDSIYQRSKNLFDRGEFQLALTEADSGFRREQSWRFRLLKAEILLSTGDPKNALDTLRGPDPESKEFRARLAMHRGQAKYLLSDYSGAHADLDQASQIAASLKEPLLDAQIELRRGPLLVRENQPAMAEESFRNVLRTAAGLDDLRLQGAAMGNLGFLFLNTYHYDEAIYWLNRARDVFEQIHLADSVARALGNLGWCYYRLGEDDEALKYLRQAEIRFRAAGNHYEQQIWLGNTGSVLLDRGESSAAIVEYEQALSIAKDLGERYWTGWWENNLATAAIMAGDFVAAERYNNEALRLRENMKDGSGFYPRVNQAHIAEGRNDFAGAEKLYRALIAEPSEDPTPLLDAESGLAELLVKRGDTARADAQFRSALALIERQRAALTRDEYKLSYFSGLIRFYQDYVDFLVASGQEKQALEAAESSRALVLDEKLHNRGTSTRDVNAAALEQLARSSNSILFSYWLAPQRSFLWVVTPNAVTLHTLPPEKKIAALVEEYGALLENLRDPLDSESPAGRELSRILLGPVRGLLKSGEHIVMVPDRALHSLNFETLPDPDHPSQYLIESATVSIAPSLGLLTNVGAHAAPSGNSILLIGDPEPAVEEYQRLPYAAKEIALIEQSFAVGNRGRAPLRSVVIEGAHAYPSAYRDSDPAGFGYIHFAAHATTNRESPLDSALILSRHESGYALSARDVMNIPLRADLVTLSACRSAGARSYSGEGLVGLSWAFLRAGAHNVVAGLWDVNDMSTANLMADFYSRLTRGAAPTDALHEAKLRLVHSSGAYRKPFYWGPFQLYTGAVR